LGGYWANARRNQSLKVCEYLESLFNDDSALKNGIHRTNRVWTGLEHGVYASVCDYDLKYSA